MNRSVVGTVLVLAVAAGCTTMSRMETYKKPVQHVAVGTEKFRVYDHKTENVLAVAPSMQDIVRIGWVQGSSLGLVDVMTPEQKLEAAAQQHLNETGRSNCKVTKGYMLQKPIYEFWFTCS